MQLSHYALLFPWPKDSSLRLLFSTRTGARALVPAATLAAIDSGCLDPASAAALAEQGLLVADRQAEMAAVLNLPGELNRLRTVIKVAVVVTMDCNFRCRYCYEGSRKEKRRMSAATAKHLIDFLAARLTPATTRLTLDFYGGEPLLATDTIRAIAAPLQRLVEDQGAEFTVTLVTNGSLLTRKNVEALLPVGLSAAKVTLDGPPEVHDGMRPFRNGRPSFSRILANMGQCAGLLPITISGNFTRDNYRHFPGLFAHLDRAGLTPETIARVTFAPVLHVNGPHATGFCGGCVASSEPWLAEAGILLNRALVRHGFPPAAGSFSPSLCMVDVDNSFVVHVDGGLYKCVTMVGNEEMRCGDIVSGMTDYRQQYHLDHWQREERCRQCVYLPLCFGGCRFMAAQRDGRPGGLECMRDLYDATIAGMALAA